MTKSATNQRVGKLRGIKQHLQRPISKDFPAYATLTYYAVYFAPETSSRVSADNTRTENAPGRSSTIFRRFSSKACVTPAPWSRHSLRAEFAISSGVSLGVATGCPCLYCLVGIGDVNELSWCCSHPISPPCVSDALLSASCRKLLCGLDQLSCVSLNGFLVVIVMRTVDDDFDQECFWAPLPPAAGSITRTLRS